MYYLCNHLRSREKARGKAKETTDRVNKLKAENEMLEDRIKLLSKVKANNLAIIHTIQVKSKSCRFKAKLLT